MSLIWWLDGKYVPQEKALIPISDLSVTRGYGIFDYLRTYNRAPFRLEDHLDRFENSARIAKLRIPLPRDEIKKVISSLFSKNKDLTELSIKLLLTAGPTEDGLLPIGKPIFAVIVGTIQSYPEKYYTEGVKVVTMPPTRVAPLAKTVNYTGAALAMQDPRAKDATEVLYVDHKQRVTELSRSNIFLVYEGKLVAPTGNILGGITKKVVIELARDLFEIEERPVYLDKLIAADEVFMTSSNKEIMPITQVDKNIIGKKKIGPVTKELMKLFREYTSNYHAEP